MTFTTRVVQLDLDIMCDSGTYDKDEFKEYVQKRIQGLGVTTVYIQVASENEETLKTDQNKMADSLLFDPGNELKAEVLCATALKYAIDIIYAIDPTIEILAWAPSLYCRFLLQDDNPAIESFDENDPLWYKRASPFTDKTKDLLTKFFTSLGKVSPHLRGLMFQDDVLMADNEDKSTPAREYIKKTFGIRADNDNVLKNFVEGVDSKKQRAWRRAKVKILDDITLMCYDAFKAGYKTAYPNAYKKRLADPTKKFMVGRDYYDGAVFGREDDTGEWNGQDIDTGLDLYDHVVVMAYYNMVNGNFNDPRFWLDELACKAIRLANSNNRNRAGKIIFKLQSVYWSGVEITKEAKIVQDDTDAEEEPYCEATDLIYQATVLLEAGATCLGVYPALQEKAVFNLETLDENDVPDWDDEEGGEDEDTGDGSDE